MANKTVQTYSPKQQAISWGGVPLTGWISCKVTSSSDAFTKEVGADGEVARGVSADDTHEIEIEFQQTSASITYINTIRIADKLTGAGMLPFVISDLSGVTRMFWLQAWVKKFPDFERKTELSPMVFMWDTGQISGDIIGGSV